MSALPRPRVLLLRAPDQPEPDRYVQALSRAGFEADSAPVLAFRLMNEEALHMALAKPERYAGLVLTSPRAAEAVRRIRTGTGEAKAWAAPTFVVGTATDAIARDVGLRTVGATAGTAEALVEVVRDHVDSEQGLPLLFVCGNRRRDVLPDRLRAAGLQVVECVAYETHLRTPSINRVAVDPERYAWVVWFSPSGVEAVFGDNSVVGGGAAVGAGRVDAWNSPRRAAIGPTTAAALSECGHPALAVAADPTPAALAHAIRTHTLTDI